MKNLHRIYVFFALSGQPDVLVCCSLVDTRTHGLFLFVFLREFVSTHLLMGYGIPHKACY